MDQETHVLYLILKLLTNCLEQQPRKIQLKRRRHREALQRHKPHQPLGPRPRQRIAVRFTRNRQLEHAPVGRDEENTASSGNRLALRRTDRTRP